jgi:hypothetical protein
LGSVPSRSETNPVDPHRAGNVLEVLLSNVVEGKVETPGYVLLNTGGHANASRLRETFQPSRNVHAVPEDIVILHNDAPW